MDNRTDGTLNNRKIYIKKFFTDNEKTELIKHINVHFNNKAAVDKSAILTVDDVNSLIEGCDSFLYQAIIACLYESGGRINEVLTIKKSELKEDVEGFYIARMDTTKTMKYTGKEYIDTQFIDSAPYIRRLLMYDSGKGDLLFYIKHLAVANHIKEVAKKVGITKRVNPHAFRHAKATSMVQEGYTEPIIKKKLGWAPDSRMMARYTHNDDEDVMDIERAKKTGQAPEKIVSVRHIAQPKLNIIEQLRNENAEMKEQMAAIQELLKISDKHKILF
jgi:integrase